MIKAAGPLDGSRWILVADDDASQRELAGEFLYRDNLDFASTPGEALAKATENPYDIILSDLTWKGNGRSLSEAREAGYSLLGDLKGLAPQVILWTSLAPSPDVQQVISLMNLDQFLNLVDTEEEALQSSET